MTLSPHGSFISHILAELREDGVDSGFYFGGVQLCDLVFLVGCDGIAFRESINFLASGECQG